ncbi:MAG: BatD family protein [Planctomycetes bacterium]|nr:BatD family protein [Planctomycetota bacterium]
MIRAFLIGLLFLQNPAARQTDAGISVQGPDPGVVRLGDSANVTVEVEGTKDCEITDVPKVAGLEVRVGGRQTKQSSIYDGKQVRVRVVTEFGMSLHPLKEGVFEIPSITLRVGSETKKTRSVRVECVKDITGTKYAILDVTIPKNSYFVNEPVNVRIRFGIDAAIIRNLIQMFASQVHLDMPIQIEAPWLEAIPGSVALDNHSKNRGEQLVTMVSNRSVDHARSVGSLERGGRTFTMFEIERSWIPGRIGDLTLSAAMLRFQFASRISKNIFGDPIAQDRQDAFVYAEPVKITVKALPEDGRPATFTGAVGKFTISADATPHDLKVGESLKFKVRIAGEGNLEYLEPPALEGLDGFHVYGHIDDKNREERIITYDLSPLNENVREIPSIPFTYFDTEGAGSFKTIKTESVGIRVRALPPGEGLAPLTDDAGKRVIPGVDDIFDMQPALGFHNSKENPGAATAALAFAAPAIAAAALFVALRRRERLLANPALARAFAARAKFTKAVDAGSDPVAALTTYLADRCGCAEAAIVSHDLDARLVSRGVPEELATRASAVLLQSLESRYGGAAASASASIAGLAAELENSFLQIEGRA